MDDSKFAAESDSARKSELMSERYFELMKKHMGDHDFMRNLTVFIRRIVLNRTLAHYEIYKKVAHLPGDVVECGVYKGESLFNFARCMEIFSAGDRVKRVIGFDHFQGLQNLSEQDRTSDSDPSSEAMDGGWNPEEFYPTLKELIALFHEDSFVPKKARIHLVEGDIRETAKKYVEVDDPGMRISLLHLDCDLYEPTLAALEAFYPRVVTGGVVLFDEYALPEFPGESQALDEYFRGKPPTLERFDWTCPPGGWFIKE